MRELSLDELVVMPAAQPWLKDGAELAPAEHRAAMAELAFEGLAKVRVSRHELQHSGPSYTVDTLRALQPQTDPAGDRWWLVIGQELDYFQPALDAAGVQDVVKLLPPLT